MTVLRRTIVKMLTKAAASRASGGLDHHNDMKVLIVYVHSLIFAAGRWDGSNVDQVKEGLHVDQVNADLLAAVAQVAEQKVTAQKAADNLVEDLGL